MQSIVTPVKVDVLQNLLIETGYDQKEIQFLVSGFRNGFSLGYQGPEKVKKYAPNLKLQGG